jgi:hypothetical protein
MKAASILTLATLLLGSGCDIALLPETASYDGDGTPRMAVVIAADAMPQGNVEAVDLELVDVLLHRESDDTWVWIGGDASRVELTPSAMDRAESVPLLADHYDRVLMVIDAPRVASGGVWHAVDLADDELELAVDLDLGADTRIELHFDVAASLSGDAPAAWSFSPQVHAELVAE